MSSNLLLTVPVTAKHATFKEQTILETDSPEDKVFAFM